MVTFIRYIQANFTFGLVDCVRYDEHFVKSRFVKSKFCPIHFTVILAGLKKTVRYTETFVIKRFVKSRFHCILFNCCAATEGSEQQHNQDLKEIYKGATNSGIHHFLPQCIAFNHTFYHNALHLTRVHCATNNSSKNTGKFGGSASFAAQT